VSALAGRVVAITAGRKAEEQADLLRRRGAEVVFAPTITTEYLSSDEDVQAATERAVAASPGHVVLLTGIGLRTWLEASRSWGGEDALLAMLRGARVVARGPKSAAAARTADIDVALVAKSERAEELLDALRDSVGPGDVVVVQRHGGVERRFTEELGERGATVIEVPLYRWRLPDDLGVVDRLIDDAVARRIDAVTFTAAPAVHNLFVIAEEHGRKRELLEAFNGGVVALCVGPVCADAARDEGIADPVFPDVGRLGLMVRALDERFATA
jgi:uroporphyrinogen-III synthase